MLDVCTRTYARSTAVLRLQCLFRTCDYLNYLGDGFTIGWHKHTHINGYLTIVFTILRCCTTIRASYSNYDATSKGSRSGRYGRPSGVRSCTNSTTAVRVVRTAMRAVQPRPLFSLQAYAGHTVRGTNTRSPTAAVSPLAGAVVA